VIPLRDNNPTRSTPVLTYLIIAANTLVYLYQSSLDPASEKMFVEQYGLIPTMLAHDPTLGSFITPLTSMFIHGGFMHLLLNMWSLFIFGDNIEDSLGKARYLFFYLLSGFAAAAAQVLVDPSSTLPMVGASGAIAGVLAAYLRLFPHARVLTLIPLFIFFFTQEIPAVLFIALWFALQVLSGLGSLSVAAGGQGGGVAFFAHIGGFVAGFLLIRSLLPARNATRGFRRPEQFPG
jgi:membrane associated rhomboid family serine protease